MKIWLIYVIVLITYLPGLRMIFKSKSIAKFPIIFSTFIGMFIFNAIGCILILLEGQTYTGEPLISNAYIFMLISQAILFYLIIGPYFHWRKNKGYRFQPDRRDNYIIAFYIVLILITLLLYWKAAGRIPLVDLLSGNINQYNVGSYRNQYIYGLNGWVFYNYGFNIFPSLLACQIFLTSLIRNKISIRDIILLMVSFIPALFLGQKTGIMELFLLLLITYAFFLTYQGLKLSTLANRKLMIIAVFILLPTIWGYTQYLGTEASPAKISNMLVFRIFGAYSESLAATIPMVDENGLFEGKSLPKVFGFVADPGSHIGMDTSMHYYLTGFPGAAPVPSVGEGYVNYGWWGFFLFVFIFFSTSIIMQELFLDFKMGVTGLSLMIWFGYLALKTSTMGIQTTLLSPWNLIIIPFALCIWLLCEIFIIPKKRIE